MNNSGIETTDLFGHFASQRHIIDDLYWEVDPHFNARGNALFANGLQKYLEKPELGN